MNPEGAGRSAITGSHGGAVWDYLPLTKDDVFTENPHLALAVTTEAVEALVNVPYRVHPTMRRNIRNLTEDGFIDRVTDIVTNLQALLAEHPGAKPLFRGQQLRYPSEKAAPFRDALIEFDLRTAVPGSGQPKAQPRWLSAAYGSFVDVKKNTPHYEIMLGVQFNYARCPEVGEPSAIDLIAETWIACKPVLDLAS